MTDHDAAHYVTRLTNMPPTEIECKCGLRMEGADCLDRMRAHVAAQEQSSDTGHAAD